MTTRPFRLLPIFQKRVWGTRDLKPWFQHTPVVAPVGEVWFTSNENQTDVGPTLGELIAKHPQEILGNSLHPADQTLCPLLVKFLFTSEKLSVQVHPDDEYARKHHNSFGKSESWYVLQADPGAVVAAGFREALTPEALQAAALSGEIENLLEWHPVAAGDTIFTPAGTVHAIGSGLQICEIQQNSDITYRLYDYGRPRELHLEHACNVSRFLPHPGKLPPVHLAAWRDQLITCPYFNLERLRLNGRLQFNGSEHHHLLISVSGSGRIAGQDARPGQVWLVPASAEPFQLDGTGSEWLLTYSAQTPTEAFTAS